MVIFDVATAFIVGGAIGWRTEGKRRDLALTAASLGVAAPGLIFLDVYPDWDWQYLIDPSTVPPGTPGYFMAAIILAALLGHTLCSHSPKTLWTALGIFGVYCAFSIPRIPYVGTRAEYLAGEAPFFPTPFLILLVCVGSVAVAIMGWCWVLADRSRSSESTG